jgi:hypothetical protein
LKRLSRHLHPGSTDGWITATLALLVAAAWLALHRYSGIAHDGVFYAAQALRHLDPVAFRGDLFFTFGSQDQYTVFTSVYAEAIRLLDLPLAATALLATAHLVWILSVAAVLRGFLQGQSLWLALLFVAALPRGYGSSNIFSYAEPFLTARVWAEAISLLAVAMAIRGQGWAALATAAIAGTLHPPMALPTAVFVFSAGFGSRTRFALVGTGVAALLSLAVFGVKPFSLLLVPMDEVWLRIASDRSPFAFIRQWQSGDFGEPLLLGTLLVMAAACAEGAARRAWFAGVSALAVGAGLSLLTAFWPSALLVQTQSWRAMWLVKILAIAAAVWLLREFWSRSALNRLILAAMAACLLSAREFGPHVGLLVAALFIAHNRYRFDPELPATIAIPVWGVLAAVTAERVGTSLVVGAAALDGASYRALSAALFGFVDETGWVLFPVTGMAAAWLMHRLPAARYVLLPTAIFFTGYLAAHWGDPAQAQRQSLARMQPLAAEVERVAPRNRLLYWEGDLALPWLGLRRGNYASPMQGAGVIFSEATAHEYVRRGTRLARLRPQQGQQWWRNPAAAQYPAPPMAGADSAGALIHLCHDPVLDYVVLARDVGVPPAHTIPAGVYGGPYRVHDCALLRPQPAPYAAS